MIKTYLYIAVLLTLQPAHAMLKKLTTNQSIGNNALRMLQHNKCALGQPTTHTKMFRLLPHRDKPTSWYEKAHHEYYSPIHVFASTAASGGTALTLSELSSTHAIPPSLMAFGVSIQWYMQLQAMHYGNEYYKYRKDPADYLNN